MGPIFILGSARSGTSIVTDAVNHSLGNFITDSSIGYHGEGFFVQILDQLKTLVDDFYEYNSFQLESNTLLANIPKSILYNNLSAVIKDLVEKHFLGRRWIDKTPTPSAIKNAPLIASLWPDAKFIYMKRRGLENLSSRLRKFNGIDFFAHCEDWVASFTEWSRVKGILGVDSYIEIDQQEIISNPELVANRLATFLVVDPSILKNDFINLRPQKTDSSNYKSLVFNNMSWSKEQKECFLNLCDACMRENGYSYDDSYWVK